MYWVNKEGSDVSGDGSRANPFRTVARAAVQAFNDNRASLDSYRDAHELDSCVLSVTYRVTEPDA